MNFQEASNEILELQGDLSIVQKKLDDASLTYQNRKAQLEEYKTQLAEEKLDVDQLENLSFSKILYKMIGKYEDKYQKEYQEYLTAKRKYDEYAVDIEQLAIEVERYTRELQSKQEQIQIKQKKLRTDYKEGQILARQEDEERQLLYRQKKELEEAIYATDKVLSLANAAKDEYSSAKSWATYDTFCNGGFISDMMKYSKVDKAAEISNQLKSASTRMKKELADVKLVFDVQLDNMNDGTRFWDMAFDNIFTDMNVRNRLAENINQLSSYIVKVEHISDDLRKQSVQVNKKISSLSLL